VTSLPATVDLTIYQGATFLQSFRWLIGTTGKDLTGWTGRMQIRSKPGDPVAIVSLTTGAGITLDASGNIVVRIEATTSTAITARGGQYDLELVAPSGDVTRFVQGKVTFSPEVTV